MDIKRFNYRNTTPKSVVLFYTNKYDNERTRASSLSRFKRELLDSDDPPPMEYMRRIMLPRSIYDRINKQYAIQKNIEGKNVPVIKNVNSNIEWAINHINSNKPEELWPSVIITSGFRPSEILTSSFIPYDGPPIVHDDFYISTYDLAKKRTVGKAVIRPHPLLVRAHEWLNAVDKLRAVLDSSLTRTQLNRKYAGTWLRWIRKAFPNIPNVTHTILRRIYATYAYNVYKGDFVGEVDRIAFIQDVLGHDGLGTSAVYGQIKFTDKQFIDIFD
jgi:hypothetical protein